jgi:hypothetical protein
MKLDLQILLGESLWITNWISLMIQGLRTCWVWGFLGSFSWLLLREKGKPSHNIVVITAIWGEILRTHKVLYTQDLSNVEFFFLPSYHHKFLILLAHYATQMLRSKCFPWNQSLENQTFLLLFNNTWDAWLVFFFSFLAHMLYHSQALNPLLLLLIFFWFWDRISLCSRGWPWIHSLSASAFQVLGLQPGTTTSIRLLFL